MDYEIKNDPYLIAGTGVFHNKLGITDENKLRRAEAQITTTELAILEVQPLPGELSLRYLQAIHRAVFGELYTWARRLRTVEMSKGDTEFAKVDALYGYAESIFDHLQDEDFLQGLPKELFVERLAHYYSELNLLHPFREGNGRVLRAFIHTLADRAKWWVDWTDLDARQNIDACIAAYHGDESKLFEMLTPLASSNE